jgi:hypothetical protein
MSTFRHCPDCDLPPQALNRRQFVQAGAAAAAAVTASGLLLPAHAAESAVPSEQLVAKLYESLTPQQREKMCFAWDHQDDRGLLRTHVSNNWNITDVKTMNVGGDFYTADQRDLIEAIFLGLYNRDWHDNLRKQLQDDAGGYGRAQTIAIFGTPGEGKWEFVMTGRHLTIRCDGDSAEHVAFGGPIFYGHAAKGFDEAADHPGNVYWHQALKANKLYEMLDGNQRVKALVSDAPYESEVAFQGPAGGSYPGIPIAALSADQKEHAQSVLKTLLEPYRVSDRDQALQCLDKQGGLDKCSLAFYREDDIGADGVWDIWRIEGPSFVWHYRGAPHVHVWVNISDDSSVATNAAG